MSFAVTFAVSNEVVQSAGRFGARMETVVHGVPLAALARLGPAHAVQSVLTGNIRPLAEAKLGALGLTGHLDLDIGAYGDHHEIRAELVHLARRNAARAYRQEFTGEAAVIIGDTPLDVAAAQAAGARSVGVATGASSTADLAAADADAVLPDLSDTDAVLAAILGGPALTARKP